VPEQTSDAPPERVEAGPVVIRRVRATDADAIAAAVSSSLEYLRPWMPWATSDSAGRASQLARVAEADHNWESGIGYVYSVLTADQGTLVGEIVGSDTLGPFAATAGHYFVNFLAIPTGPDDAGTYALNMSQAPPAPVVNLSADATSVSIGGTAHLIWSTQGATTCTESGGGWTGTLTGAQVASGTATSPAITATTTFTLTCEGAGGTTVGSVTVTATPASSGGGEIGKGMLLLLGSCLIVRLRALKSVWSFHVLKTRL